MAQRSGSVLNFSLPCLSCHVFLYQQHCSSLQIDCYCTHTRTIHAALSDGERSTTQAWCAGCLLHAIRFNHLAMTLYQLQSLLPFCSAVQCKHHRGVILDTWKCSLSIVPTLLKYPLSNLPSQPTLGEERNTNLSNFITLNLTLFLSCTFLFRRSPLAPRYLL